VASRGCARAAGVLHRDNDDAVLRFLEDVDDDEPTPRPHEEAISAPTTGQLWPEPREACERSQGALHALARVCRQAQDTDESIQVFFRCASYFYSRHRLEVVQGSSVTATRLFPAELGTLPSTRDGVENLSHCPGVRIGVIKGSRQQ
jgi:hypothetical protein